MPDERACEVHIHGGLTSDGRPLIAVVLPVYKLNDNLQPEVILTTEEADAIALSLIRCGEWLRAKVEMGGGE